MNKERRLVEICDAHARREGPLLPILKDVQEEFGCIDAESEVTIAKALNLSRADVHGVVSFYHDFCAEADQRPEVQICRAEACKARGVEQLMGAAQAAAGDRVRLSDVYCLGLCSAGPCARIGDQFFARLDESSMQQLVESA